MTTTRLAEICGAMDHACKDYQVFVLAQSLLECMPVQFGLKAAQYSGCVALETCDSSDYRQGMKFCDFKEALKNSGVEDVKFHWSKKWGHDHYWDFADRMPVIGSEWPRIIFYLENETLFVDGELRPPRTKSGRMAKG